jgi:hypothetical protein
MKRTILSIALLAGLSSPAMAATNSWEAKAKDAWRDGKAEAMLLFNDSFNLFDINTDVTYGKVILSAKLSRKQDIFLQF